MIGDAGPYDSFEEIEGVETAHVVLKTLLKLAELVRCNQLVTNSTNVAAAGLCFLAFVIVIIFGLLFAPLVSIEDTKDAITH